MPKITMPKNSLRTVFTTSAILLTAAFQTYSFARQTPRIEVAGVSVSQKDPDSEFGRSLSGFGTAGTSVDLYLKLPKQTILSIDRKQSSIDLSCDDGGKLPLRDQFNGVLSLSFASDDKSIAAIQLGSEKLPGKKTTKFTLSGTIVLVVGKDLKTSEAELTIENNSKVKLGSVDATVTVRAEDAEFNPPDSQLFTLTASRSFDMISNLEFLDSSGKVIQSEPAGSGSGSWGDSDDLTYTNSYFVQTSQKNLKVRFSYFESTDRVKLPIDKTFGFGM